MYRMLNGMGAMGCEEGEEFDLTSLQCVTAGQARTPVPSTVPLPTPIPNPIPSPPPPGPPPPPPPPPPDYTMWLMIGGAVLLGGLVVAVAGRAATPNRRRRRRRARRNGRRRPPKQWMRHCEAGARGSRDPGAVCGSLWYHKMTAKQRQAAKRRSYGR